MRKAKALMLLLIVGVCVSLLAERTAFGQASGNVLGTISDATGARIPGAKVTAVNQATGISRSTVADEAGRYSFASLPPGDYEVSAEMSGFSRAVQQATVNVGRDVTMDFRLEVGAVTQTIEVAAEASQINLVDSKVDEIVSRSNIADLPLIGRNAYELAKLVPMARVSSSTTRNTQVDISIAGNDGGRTRITVDGINVADGTTAGGMGQNFSQEVVQEFQVSTANFDPSAGITEAGRVNIVTRSGGNQFHGTIFGYFRDNDYAGYPGLSRAVPRSNPTNNPLITEFNDTQAHPDFSRRQFGGMFNGPLI